METKLLVSAVKVFGIIMLIAFAIGIVWGLFLLVRSLIKAFKAAAPVERLYHFFRIACVIIMIASWFLNFGWYRYFLTFVPIPIFHMAFFVFVTGMAISRFGYSSQLKIHTVICYVTYLMGYLFFPDGSDYGPAYMFFGLIRNDAATDIGGVISIVGFTANAVILIITFIKCLKIKTKQLKECGKGNETWD